jgi:nucleoside-diphosphate-sugar epimerase
VAALATDVPAGVYNVGDNDHRSATWFSGEVARQLGLPAPPQIGREAANQQFSPQRLSFLMESRRVDTAKMRRVLGVTPRYANPEDGIRASLP